MALARSPHSRLPARKVWALLLLLAMAAHTLYKLQNGILPELLWGCNIASFLIILGLWVDCPTLVGPGFLWHICLGDVAFALGVAMRGQAIWPLFLAGWTSVLVHTLPTVAALLFLVKRGLPRCSPYLALLLFIVLVPISHYLTPAHLNINMAHVRWHPLSRVFPGNWSYRIVFSLCMLSLFLLGDFIGGRTMGRPKRSLAGGWPDPIPGGAITRTGTL